MMLLNEAQRKRMKLGWGSWLVSIWQFEKGHLDSQSFLDSLKNDISTNLDKVFAIKSRFVSIFTFVSILTFQKPTSRLSIKSGQFENGHLDVSRHLDLDCSRLSRPLGLESSYFLLNILRWKINYCHELGKT